MFKYNNIIIYERSYKMLLESRHRVISFKQTLILRYVL